MNSSVSPSAALVAQHQNPQDMHRLALIFFAAFPGLAPGTEHNGQNTGCCEMMCKQPCAACAMPAASISARTTINLRTSILLRKNSLERPSICIQWREIHLQRSIDRPRRRRKRCIQNPGTQWRGDQRVMSERKAGGRRGGSACLGIRLRRHRRSTRPLATRRSSNRLHVHPFAMARPAPLASPYSPHQPSPVGLSARTPTRRQLHGVIRKLDRTPPRRRRGLGTGQACAISSRRGSTVARSATPRPIPLGFIHRAIGQTPIRLRPGLRFEQHHPRHPLLRPRPRDLAPYRPKHRSQLHHAGHIHRRRRRRTQARRASLRKVASGARSRDRRWADEGRRFRAPSPQKGRARRDSLVQRKRRADISEGHCAVRNGPLIPAVELAAGGKNSACGDARCARLSHTLQARFLIAQRATDRSTHPDDAPHKPTQ